MRERERSNSGVTFFFLLKSLMCTFLLKMRLCIHTNSNHLPVVSLCVHTLCVCLVAFSIVKMLSPNSPKTNAVFDNSPLRLTFIRQIMEGFIELFGKFRLSLSIFIDMLYFSFLLKLLQFVIICFHFLVAP